LAVEARRQVDYWHENYNQTVSKLEVARFAATLGPLTSGGRLLLAAGGAIDKARRPRSSVKFKSPARSERRKHDERKQTAFQFERLHSRCGALIVGGRRLRALATPDARRDEWPNVDGHAR